MNEYNKGGYAELGHTNLSIRDDTVFVWELSYYHKSIEINLGDVWDVDSRVSTFPGEPDTWVIGLKCNEYVRCARTLTEDGELTDRPFGMTVSVLRMPSPRVLRSLTNAMAELLDLVERRR